MCGIFGAVNLAGYFDERDYARFVDLTHIVDHRGPDGSRSVALACNEGNVATPEKFDVFLGHTRLAIIDLTENASQPMSNRHQAWISFNGEIFNYIELREELRSQHGYRFTSESDTEVILAVYSVLGPKTFSRLNGMWAFAIVDLVKKQVVLSRDRFSEKPLYYYQQGQSIFFSSEIKQLLPLLASTEVNHKTMGLYLGQGLIDCNQETFFKGIFKVRPRHNLLISFKSGSIREEEYWNFELTEQSRSPERAVEEFRHLLTDSIRIRLRSDVKVGALLSGGLDSSTISLVANNLTGGNFESYSVLNKFAKYSETPFVDAVVQSTGLANRKLMFDVSDVLSSTENVLYHNDEPPGGFSAIAHYKMMELIKKETDVTVLLSGQGGDELLLGYRKFFFFFLQDLLRKRAFGRLGWEILGSLINRTVLFQFQLGEARRYMPFGMDRKMNYLMGTNYSEPIAESHDLALRQRADIEKYSVPNLTHYEDRNSMAFGLEIRLPFLDSRLVNFALSLPATQKIHHGWTKYVLRQAFPELPYAIQWRRDKQGFILPEERWLKEDLAPVIRETFQHSLLTEMGIVDSRRFLNYFDEFRTDKRRIWYNDISRTFLAELWARRMFSKPNIRETVPPISLPEKVRQV